MVSLPRSLFRTLALVTPAATVRAAVSLASVAATVSLAGCSRPAPDEPVAGGAAGEAAALPVDAALATGGPSPLSRLSRKEPPPLEADAGTPVARRDPDWDLDPSDPGRDYVRRYVVGAQRYGAATGCVKAQPSVPANGKAQVRVTDAEPPVCPQPSGVDETFAVDVAADRLELVGQQADRPKLKPWPDGSDPYAPPKVPVPEFADPGKWTAPVGQALKTEKLVPIRIQMYGRGTYPFVMLAGFPDWFPRSSDQPTRDAFASRMCAASSGMPLAIGGGLDRSNVLRVRCGHVPTAVWDQL